LNPAPGSRDHLLQRRNYPLIRTVTYADAR